MDTTTNIIDQCRFTDNKAEGAARFESAADNSGTAYGGAVFHGKGRMMISGSIFTNNIAVGGHGAGEFG
jgi:hypothetical protein